MKLLRLISPLVAVAAMFASQSSLAADAVNGKLLYETITPLACANSGCHGANPANNQNNILKGSSWTAIRSAITGNKGGMLMYSAATDAQLQDIAAYIANPSAGTPSPMVSLSASSIAFGSAQVGTTMASKTVTLSNTGTAALTINSITLGGTNMGDFARTGTCAAGSLAAGASCTVGASFTPAAAGARAASISITHNAANSPHTINLSGTGTAVVPTAPVASISPMTVSFGSVAVGSTSAAQKVTIANTGNAPLNVGAITVSGMQMADFSASGCANTAVAAGASCAVNVTYKPAAAGASTASLSIAHNATGSPGAVALSGTGTQTPPPTGAVASFSPMSVSFGSQKVGTTSATQTVTISNTGTAALSITNLTVTGSNAAEFALSGNTCTAGSSVAVGASCSTKVSFTPSMSGSRSANLTLQSNATGNNSAALSGVGMSDSNGLLQLTQSGLVIDKIKVEDNGTHAKILIKNTSNHSIKVEKIVFTVGANYKIEDQCSGKTLKPGKSCEIEIEYKGPKVSSGSHSEEDKADSINITTDTGAEMSIGIDLKPADAVATTPAVVDSSIAAATPKAGGGCTIGSSDQFDGSHIAMLLAAAGVLMARRRKAAQAQR